MSRVKARLMKKKKKEKQIGGVPRWTCRSLIELFNIVVINDRYLLTALLHVRRGQTVQPTATSDKTNTWMRGGIRYSDIDNPYPLRRNVPEHASDM